MLPVGVMRKIKMKTCHSAIFAVLLISNSLNAAECIYVPKQTTENPYPELSPQGNCGQLLTQDTFQLGESHFNKLYFSKNGLASFFYEGSVFYVSKAGKVVRAYFFDNAADYFVEGVARTILNNKFGYIDEQLNVVIKPEYDFVFPFKNEVAVVCNGCRFEPDGEHNIVVDGKWGAINKSGKIVIPIKQSKNALLENPKYKRILNLEKSVDRSDKL